MTRLSTPKEKDFQWTIIEYAKLRGWLVYHTYDSRKCQAGFPDLVMVREPRVVFAELKVGKNILTDTQREWIVKLRLSNQEVYVWYPEDWDNIEEVLR